jgi:hypothetical protein
MVQLVPTRLSDQGFDALDLAAGKLVGPGPEHVADLVE